MERLKRNFQNRVTLPNDEYVGQIFKIEMMLASNDYNYTIINMGAHLFTDEVNEEVTIRQFNGNTTTYGMGHTRSAPASIDEIQQWLSEYWDNHLPLAGDSFSKQSYV